MTFIKRSKEKKKYDVLRINNLNNNSKLSFKKLNKELGIFQDET